MVWQDNTSSRHASGLTGADFPTPQLKQEIKVVHGDDKFSGSLGEGEGKHFPRQRTTTVKQKTHLKESKFPIFFSFFLAI